MIIGQTVSYWVELAILLGILAIMVSVARYFIRKTRAETLQHEPQTSDLLLIFSEWHRRGKLSDAEFRTIKTALTEQLHTELKDDGETG